jgi:hypothetical protein
VTLLMEGSKKLDPADVRPEEHRWYRRAIEALNRRGIRCMLAGAFGLYFHTGLWRNTKDMDLLVLPEDREDAIEAICGAGLRDLFPQEAYDREWIFRGTRDGIIVDLIWRLANKADEVGPDWFERAPHGTFLGLPVQYASAADMCWMKLFVFQAKRCDWPDLLNVIRGTQGHMDWNHLLQEVGEHWRLLCGLVDVFDWLCPAERHYIPRDFRQQLEALRRSDADAGHASREDLFDTRSWLTQPGAGCCDFELDSEE